MSVIRVNSDFLLQFLVAIEQTSNHVVLPCDLSLAVVDELSAVEEHDRVRIFSEHLPLEYLPVCWEGVGQEVPCDRLVTLL